MPRLDDSAASRVAEAETSSGVMDEGIYEMILIEVEAKEGPNGPYWNWTFAVPEDAERYPKWRQWLVTSLSEKSAWRLKETFAAFGVDPDTDTDELIGQRVRAQIGQHTIQKGARAGEVGNNIKKLLPVDESAGAEGSGGLF